jgi:hypothetical protein
VGWLRRRRGRHVAGRVVFLDPAGQPADFSPQRPVAPVPVTVQSAPAPVPAPVPAPPRPHVVAEHVVAEHVVAEQGPVEAVAEVATLSALPELAALLESLAEAQTPMGAPARPASAPVPDPRPAPTPRRADRDVPWPGPAVSLVFVDGSEFRLPAGDATAQELIAIAGELTLGVTRRTA